MPNATRGEVAVGDYVLVYDFNALCEAEGAIGKPITALDWNSLGLMDMRALLWAGLQSRHPGITIKDAGAIAQKIGAGRVMEAVGEAMTSAFGAGDDSGNATGPGQ